MGKADVTYSVNGKEFGAFGVYVASSSGIVSKLEEKDVLSVDWTNEHGVCVDRSNIYYKPRTITLGCFIEAFSVNDFLDKAKSFLSEFEGAGTQRLRIDIGTKPLVYEVYSDVVDINKKWNDMHMVGTFTLKLVEPEPVKRVLSGKGQVAINISTPKRLNVYWGDGTHSYDIIGDVSLAHTYPDSVGHEIIITGDISKITSMTTTNCTVLWNRLQ